MYKKLYTVILVLIVFTHFTFQAEARADPLQTSGLKANPNAWESDRTAAEVGPDEIEMVPTSLADEKGIDSSDPAQRHEQILLRSIARDIFFNSGEQAFYESEWQKFLVDWSKHAGPSFQNARASNPGLTPVEFFALDQLNWPGFKCGLEYEDGCTNVPSQLEVRQRLSKDRHRARQVYFSIEAIRKSYRDSHLFKKTLRQATSDLVAHCSGFSKIFFHPATNHESHLCIAKIIGIIISIIVALVDTVFAILSLGALAEAYADLAFKYVAVTFLDGYDYVIAATPEAFMESAAASVADSSSLFSTSVYEESLYAASSPHLRRSAPEDDHWEFLKVPTTSHEQIFLPRWANGSQLAPGNWVAQDISATYRPAGAFQLSRLDVPQNRDWETERKVRETKPFQLGVGSEDGAQNSSSHIAVALIWGMTEFFPVDSLGKSTQETESVYNIVPGKMPQASWSLYRGLALADDKRGVNSELPHESVQTGNGKKKPTWIVSRKVPLFAIVPAGQGPDGGNRFTDSLNNLDKIIARRFRHSNGSWMDGGEAINFMQHHGESIAQRVNSLGKPSNEFVDEEDTLPKHWASLPEDAPTFEIRGQVHHVPWSQAFGNLHFLGTEGKGDPAELELQYRWEPATVNTREEPPNVRPRTWRKRTSVSDLDWTEKESHMQGISRHFRDVQKSLEGLRGSHLPSLHDVNGIMGKLEALGLGGSNQNHLKRDAGSGIEKEGNIFKVRMNNAYFHNSITDTKCGIDNYTGNTAKNEQACEEFLHQVEDRVINRLEEKLKSMNDPGIPWIEGHSSPLAQHLEQRYKTYHNFIVFDLISVNPEILRKRLFENLKNGLITKAYADEQCYLKCSTNRRDGWLAPRDQQYSTPWHFDREYHDRNPDSYRFGDVTCQPGCYEPTQRKFPRLYGIESEARKDPWNVNEEVVVKASWEAYEARDPVGYLPGNFDMNPYKMSVKDFTPLLPVCSNDYIILSRGMTKDQFPCMCGNKYGNESEMFWAASHWDQSWEVNKVVRDCRKGPLQELMHHHPAAYIVNSCQLYYGALKGNKKHDKTWADNVFACQIYLDYYEHHKDESDESLNSNMCKLWSKYHRHIHAPITRNHQTFERINQDIYDHSCKPYGHDYWDHNCKKGKHMERCQWPDDPGRRLGWE